MFSNFCYGGFPLILPSSISDLQERGCILLLLLFVFLLYCMLHSALCIASDGRFFVLSGNIEASRKTNSLIVLDFWCLLLSDLLLSCFWTVSFSLKSLVCIRKSLIILYQISDSGLSGLCLSCPYSLCSLYFPYRITFYSVLLVS